MFKLFLLFFRAGLNITLQLVSADPNSTIVTFSRLSLGKHSHFKKIAFTSNTVRRCISAENRPIIHSVWRFASHRIAIRNYRKPAVR